MTRGTTEKGYQIRTEAWYFWNHEGYVYNYYTSRRVYITISLYAWVATPCNDGKKERVKEHGCFRPHFSDSGELK